MAFVVDASFAVTWAFADEIVPAYSLERLLSEPALVPSLWWFELRNTLVVAERRKRITEAETGKFLELIGRLPLRVDLLPDEPEVLRLARARRLTVYDASYLELAKRNGVPLATFDSALIAAAHAEGVALLTEPSAS